MRPHFILIALLACSTGARVSASDAQAGYVSDISPLRSGIVLFSHSGAHGAARLLRFPRALVAGRFDAGRAGSTVGSAHRTFIA